jgi:AAA ATPase domain
MDPDLPLVARGADLAILTGAIEAAKSRRGEAMLFTGEAGVGKTRLLVEAQPTAAGRAASHPTRRRATLLIPE